MRSWPADHPKAKLLGQKRADILAAARRQFLAHGYGGTSMEAITADAGVSIMTLYRHAERKDELFEAVISIACDPEEEAAGAEAFAAKPLRELLVHAKVPRPGIPAPSFVRVPELTPERGDRATLVGIGRAHHDGGSLRHGGHRSPAP